MTGLPVHSDRPPPQSHASSGEADDDGAGCRYVESGSLRPIFFHPVVILAVGLGLAAWVLIFALAIQHMRWP